ncbi:MAG: flagellar brake protein [Candidatus Accumulibacter sp.]|jgi:c-di-GMP-binding flagellar brake protein YcgR|nr:flagellar brake protein [Accumulibacter sp.]
MTIEKASAPPRDAGTNVSFGDMNFQVGSRIQLLTSSGTKKKAYYSTLIGYEDGKYLFVKMPLENGYSVPLKEAERIEVRFFSGISIYTFASCVEFIYANRRTFLELSFPQNIRMFPLRRDIRISSKLAIDIWKKAGTEISPHETVTAIDLSITGAMLQGYDVLGDAGDEIGISFSVRNSVTKEDVLIKTVATIRNVLDGKDQQGRKVGKYGISLSQLDSFQIIVLQNYIYENMLEGKQID